VAFFAPMSVAADAEFLATMTRCQSLSVHYQNQHAKRLKFAERNRLFQFKILRNGFIGIDSAFLFPIKNRKYSPSPSVLKNTSL
jgi:hypothetical protein